MDFSSETLYYCRDLCGKDPKTCGNKPLTYKTKNGLKVQVCRKNWARLMALMVK